MSPASSEPTPEAIEDALAFYFASVAERRDPGSASFVPNEEFWHYIGRSGGTTIYHYRPFLNEVYCEKKSDNEVQCLVPYQWREQPRGQFATDRKIFTLSLDASEDWLVTQQCDDEWGCGEVPVVSEAFKEEVRNERAQPLVFNPGVTTDADHLNLEAFEVLVEGEGLARREYLKVISDDVGYGYANQGLRAGQVFSVGLGRTQPMLGRSNDPLDLLTMLATIPPGADGWMKTRAGETVRLRHVSLQELKRREEAEERARQEADRLSAARARAGANPSGIPAECRGRTLVRWWPPAGSMVSDTFTTPTDWCAKILYIPADRPSATIPYTAIFRFGGWINIYY
ncbi:MAG: hypothetical protein AAF681_05830 [Pseudomonadota bacterium]